MIDAQMLLTALGFNLFLGTCWRRISLTTKQKNNKKRSESKQNEKKKTEMEKNALSVDRIVFELWSMPCDVII